MADADPRGPLPLRQCREIDVLVDEWHRAERGGTRANGAQERVVEGEDDRPVREAVLLQEVDDEAGEEIPGRGEGRGDLFVLQLEEENGFPRTGRTGGAEEVEDLRE